MDKASLKLIEEYFNSEEGIQWIETNSFVFDELKEYITHENKDLDPAIIKKIAKHFPEFRIKATAYRAIYVSQDKKETLKWDSRFPNTSWSFDENTYRKVLKSMSLKNQYVQIYKAEVEGIDLHLFVRTVSQFLPVNHSFKNCQSITAHEQEILVLDYHNLEFVDHDVVE